MSPLTAYDTFIQQALKYGFSLWGTAKSGQKTSYRDGDDGDLEKGYPKAPPRFKDNGDGTITDNASGLMWVKEPGAIGGNFGSAGNPSKMTWFNAIDECLALAYAGHNDWRLPNIKVLLTIMDFSQSNPAIDLTVFPNCKDDLYWSSTTYPALTTSAYFGRFTIGGAVYGGKTGEAYVRPVRLGVPKA